MRKTLPYRADIQNQDNGHFCGPATVQNILASRKYVSEAQLGREMGTTTNGTDYIGLLMNCLNRHLPSGKYAQRQIPGNSATKAQKDQLWSDIKRSIDAGYGVAMNWIAPPSNYPRGVNGSQSPSYAGGTVYHYVAAMGYDDSNKTVFIVDSGFRPFAYWITLDQCANLIAGKGYTYATAGNTNTSTNTKVNYELTNKFLSRVKDSPYRDTAVGYILNIDAATWRAEKNIQKLESEINDIIKRIK